MSDMNPTFSIIMTSFNYAPYIGAAIESTLAQTFQGWELLIVDDCSTDDSWRIIQSFDDPRIKIHRHAANSGACAAYNQALSMAHGDYIACLDSDDMFMPTKLERQAAFLAEHPEVDVCGTFVTEIDGNGFVSSEETPYADWFNISVDLNDPARWLWENRLCHSGAVVRAELHSQLGEFDNRLIYTPDWQFWLRALVAGARFAVINEPLVGYRNHGNNITHKSPPGTLLEHAKTSGHILFPWLQQKGYMDLIEKTVQGFIGNPALVSASNLRANIAECLFSGSAAIDTGAAIMRLAIRQEAELLAKKAQLAEVLKDKELLESQWKASQVELIEMQQSKELVEGQLRDQLVRLDRLQSALPIKLLKKIGIISDA